MAIQANHYGTVVDADQFFENRLHSFDWTQSTTDDKTKALNQATELIDQFDYISQKNAIVVLGDCPDEDDVNAASLAQPLEFPRGSSNVVPTEIEHATYLIAQKLLGGRDPELDLESLTVRFERYGNLQTSRDTQGNTNQHMAHLIPSPQAYNLLRPFFRHRNKFTIRKVQ